MKICKIENCNNPVFTNGYCKNHIFHVYKEREWAKNPKKQRIRSKPKKIFSTELGSIKSNNKISSTTDDTSWGFDNQISMFQAIWQHRSKVSFISGKKLDFFDGTEFFLHLFAHVLAKGQNKYPKYKLNPYNIVLLTPEEHHLLDNGTEDQRNKYAEKCKEQGLTCDWTKLHELKNKLKTEYEKQYKNKVVSQSNS